MLLSTRTTCLRHVFGAALVAMACTAVNARVWDNSASDGLVTVGPTGDYTTLKACGDAFNAVSGGVTASWVIELQQSGLPYTEAASAWRLPG